MFAVALLSTSCCKDDPIVPDPETLAEQYPDWVNLTWVSTDGNDNESDPTNYPRLNITINGDVVTVNQPTTSTGGANNGQYSDMTIVSGVVTFEDDGTDGELDPTITATNLINDGVQISLRTKGLSPTFHDYVLQIN